MTPLRVLIASPDDGLRARVRAVVAMTGHQVVLESTTPFDALEACLEGRVEIAILDESMRSMRGSEVAAVLRDLRSRILTIVIHRGELTGDEELLALNPAREGFAEALANVLQGDPGRQARWSR
jgi:DNA-binding NarL/FixJ family response regulator